MKNVKQVVEKLVRAKTALNEFYDLKPARPVPGSPASDKELTALESYLRSREVPFPPSYRAFLAVHNGIKAFDKALNLLSAGEVRKPVDPSLVSDFPALSKFVIALGNTPAFISFDPETATKAGEMEVVWVADDGAERRFPNFDAFLQTIREELEEAVTAEEGDRKNLHD